MSCCGSQRRQMRINAPRAPVREPGRRLPAPYFQYFGPTGLMVRGPVTGRVYRFAIRGAALAVDPRDRRGLANVPNLREVTGP